MGQEYDHQRGRPLLRRGQRISKPLRLAPLPSSPLRTRPKGLYGRKYVRTTYLLLFPALYMLTRGLPNWTLQRVSGRTRKIQAGSERRNHNAAQEAGQSRSITMSQEEILIYERDDTESLYYTWHFTIADAIAHYDLCLLYTSPSPRDRQKSRMPSSA